MVAWRRSLTGVFNELLEQKSSDTGDVWHKSTSKG